MNKKITTIAALTAVIALVILPIASASFIFFAYYNYGTQQNMFSMETAGQKTAQSFNASATGELEGVTVSLMNDGTWASGCWIRCYIYSLSGTYKTNAVPDELLYTSTTVYSYTDLTGTLTDKIFFFSGATLTAGTQYFIVIGINQTKTTGAIRCGGYVSTGAPTKGDYVLSTNGVSWTWVDNDDVLRFTVWGGTSPTPTPTPTPTAAPTGDGGNWIDDSYGGNNTGISWLNTTVPFFVPLILIIVCGLLGYKFGGFWGFFAGINLGVILSYVIFPTLFPLWGVVAMMVVDGLMLFGKVTATRGEQ